MNTTIVFPDHFEVLSAKGHLLKMTRLFRFRYYERNSSELQDYVAAMETKHEPFLNNSMLIDVFKLDPITGAPLWESLDNEEIYAVARNRYQKYQDAGFFIGEYRKRVCKKWGANQQLLSYLEELEINMLCQSNPREVALSLLANLNKKHKILRDLHRAMCSVDKDEDMRAAADTLVFTLWSEIDGLEIGAKLLYEVGVKKTLLNALYELILMDAGNGFRMRNCVRDYILHTYWEKPCRLDQVRLAFDDYLRKATIIRELLDQYDKVGSSCNVKKEDIQALFLDPEWRSNWHTYRHELFEQSGSDRKGF